MLNIKRDSYSADINPGRTFFLLGGYSEEYQKSYHDKLLRKYNDWIRSKTFFQKMFKKLFH